MLKFFSKNITTGTYLFIALDWLWFYFRADQYEGLMKAKLLAEGIMVHATVFMLFLAYKFSFFLFLSCIYGLFIYAFVHKYDENYHILVTFLLITIDKGRLFFVRDKKEQDALRIRIYGKSPLMRPVMFCLYGLAYLLCVKYIFHWQTPQSMAVFGVSYFGLLACASARVA